MNHLTTVQTATDYIKELRYDEWYLFLFIPEEIKREVIIQMDECTDQFYTFIWEGSWFKRVMRGKTILVNDKPF